MAVGRNTLGSPTFGERLVGAARPSVEALLLAALALGCAQAGWGLLVPSNAGASSGVGDTAEPSQDLLQVQSPFAPIETTGHAAPAMLSSMQLLGIRVAEEPSRSGAIFTLADGGQRAFIVGQEVADGVVLSEVTAGHVLLSYGAGEHKLEMTAGPSFSFARAMMGLEPAVGAPALAEAAPVVAANAPSDADLRSWLGQMANNVVIEDGQARGWRIVDPPAIVVEQGLRAGDVVVGVNGAGPSDVAALASIAQGGGSLSLKIERDGVTSTLVIEAGQAT